MCRSLHRRSIDGTCAAISRSARRGALRAGCTACRWVGVALLITDDFVYHQAALHPTELEWVKVEDPARETPHVQTPW